MLMSNLFGQRLRDKPSDANLASHIFLIRGGYIRPVGSGIFSLMSPAVRVQRKIEKIIREEMNKIEGQEVILPVTIPAELWKKSGRFESVGSELLRFKDRCDRDMVLAMTHEEAAVHLAQSEAKSYSDYPFMIYQIQTKFRDEPRARGGLIRVREFTMKDAYSFHTSQEDLENYYNRVHKAYEEIFEKVGLKNTVSICSDTGMMGGSKAHEFMLLSDAGEDTIVICPDCGYKANMEVAVSELEKSESKEEALEEVYTPDAKTIDKVCNLLNADERKSIKAVLYSVQGKEKPVLIFIRGDLKVNESKLRNLIKGEIKEMPDPSQYGLTAGFIGPDKSFTDVCEVIFDKSLEGEKSLVCGANKKDYHFKGFNIERDYGEAKYFDISKVEKGQKCVHCGKELTLSRGIEIGNIFQLGTKYTDSMGMRYVSNEGKQETPIMGCYGIGVGRLMACIIEENHDNYGPIWPKTVAPWQVHICILKVADESVKEAGFKLYNDLSNKYEVIMDDRKIGAGAQFADADLLGVPVRVVVSKRNLENNQYEVSMRGNKESKLMTKKELENYLENFYSSK